jgi:Fe-S-cluster containining protein
VVARRLCEKYCGRGLGIRIHTLIVENKYPGTEFQDRFCAKCGAHCCRVGVWVPLLRDEFKKMNYLARTLKRDVTLSIEQLKDVPVWVMSHSTGPCGFLDPDTNRCIIYADRPAHCRDYFCGIGLRTASP